MKENVFLAMDSAEAGIVVFRTAETVHIRRARSVGTIVCRSRELW